MRDPQTLCDLRGMGVLVTRPAVQAEPLCAWIQANQGRPVRFPAMEIFPRIDQASRRRLAAADSFDLLIFVSTNAVHHAIEHLPAGGIRQAAAVGAATARALADAGFTDVLTPRTTADSDGLLALPEMRSVKGKRILIIRGTGGRPLLGDTLAGRGAGVVYAEVYERRIPQSDPSDLLRQWEQSIDTVIATYGEILENLLKILNDDHRLKDTPLVVVSARVARKAEQQGFTTVVEAAGAGESAIITSLCGLA